MNKLSLALITLLVGLQSSPILANAQAVTVKENYIPFFLNGMNYKDNNGIAQPGFEWDVTAKMLIKNNSVNVNMNTFHYIHFWDSSDAYLGHYATSTAESCNSVCLGVLPPSISTSYAIPLPPTAHTFALGRFDRADANYEISNGVTIEEFFETQTNYYENNNIVIDELNGNTLEQLFTSINLSENHDITDSYWKTNGTISTLNNYYYAVGKNLFDKDSDNNLIGYEMDQFGKLTTNPDWFTTSFIPVKPNTTYRRTNFGQAAAFYDINNNFISGFANVNSTFTTPLGTYYIRLNGLLINKDTCQLEQGSTATTYESFITPTISINLTDLGLSALTKTQLDNYFFNFYEYNRTTTFGFTPGVFSYITEEYYADDVREFVWNLTKIFGAGNEPSSVDIGNYETDYLFLDEHSTITETAWRNQVITSSTTIWDDQVASTLDNTFLTIISGAVAFLLMLLGIGYRNPLFNLLSIGAFILFTIQFTNVAMIIVGIALMIINALYVAKRRI